MTDFKTILIADELLPGYIDRRVEDGSLSQQDAQYIRENYAAIKAQEVLVPISQRQDLSLDEFFVVSAIRAGDIE